MSDWPPPPCCPDCDRPLRRLEPPVFLAEMLPPLYRCLACVVQADRLGQVVTCPKLFVERDEGRLEVAPDVAQWALAQE